MMNDSAGGASEADFLKFMNENDQRTSTQVFPTSGCPATPSILIVQPNFKRKYCQATPAPQAKKPAAPVQAPTPAAASSSATPKPSPFQTLPGMDQVSPSHRVITSTSDPDTSDPTTPLALTLTSSDNFDI